MLEVRTWITAEQKHTRLTAVWDSEITSFSYLESGIKVNLQAQLNIYFMFSVKGFAFLIGNEN